MPSSCLEDVNLVCGFMGCRNTDDIAIVVIPEKGTRAVCPDHQPGGEARGD